MMHNFTTYRTMTVSNYCIGTNLTMQYCGCFATIVCNVRREILLLVPNHPHSAVGKLEAYCANIQYLVCVNTAYLQHKGALYDSKPRTP